MPNELISTDPVVAQNFFLEIDGVTIVLSGVSGLQLEFDVVTIEQRGKSGKVEQIKTRGSVIKVPDLAITRMAPMDAKADPIWKWFGEVQAGFKGKDRTKARKNGSVVLYDTSLEEIGRWNFYNAWPSKIAPSDLKSDSNEAMTESITLVIERLERAK
jgi:phage tail-like protein